MQQQQLCKAVATALHSAALARHGCQLDVLTVVILLLQRSAHACTDCSLSESSNGL
jgi:hypothetical protein